MKKINIREYLTLSSHVIENPIIMDIDSVGLAGRFADRSNDFEYYVLERFFYYLKDHDLNMPDGMFAAITLTDAAMASINHIKSLKAANKLIEYSLEMDHGDIVQINSNKFWEVKWGVDKSNIFRNDTSKVLDAAIIARYKLKITNDCSPVLVCEEYNDKYYIIDGNHRYQALQESSRQHINIIATSNKPFFSLSGAL